MFRAFLCDKITDLGDAINHLARALRGEACDCPSYPALKRLARRCAKQGGYPRLSAIINSVGGNVTHFGFSLDPEARDRFIQMVMQAQAADRLLERTLRNASARDGH